MLWPLATPGAASAAEGSSMRKNSTMKMRRTGLSGEARRAGGGGWERA